MEQTLPGTCNVNFENPNELFNITLTVSPDEGYWAGGTFHFHIFVTEDYNMAVSVFAFFNTDCSLILLQIEICSVSHLLHDLNHLFIISVSAT